MLDEVQEEQGRLMERVQSAPDERVVEINVFRLYQKYDADIKK